MILSLLLGSMSAIGQQPAYSIFWEDQFEGVDIYHMIQDLDYNYWFATDQGIYRHDGYAFEKIVCSEMKGESVFNFVINSKGVIYCLNLNQQVFQIKDGICSVVFNFPNASPDNSIILNSADELIISDNNSIYVLNANNTLIHTKNFGKNLYMGTPFELSSGQIISHSQGSNYLIIYHKGKFAQQKITLRAPREITTIDALQFYRISSTCYAIDRLSKRIYLFNEKTFELTYLKLLDWQPMSEALRYYNVGNLLWMTSNISGVAIMRNPTIAQSKVSKFFNDFYISFVYEDREGNILLSTFDEGVIVIPNVNVPDVKHELAGYDITRFCADNKGGLYLGTGDGQIIAYDSKFNVLPITGDKRIESLFKISNRDQFISDGFGGCGVYDFKANKLIKSNIGSLKDFTEVGENSYLAGFNIGLFRVHIDQQGVIIKENELLRARIYRISHEATTNTAYVSSSSGLHCISLPSGRTKTLLFDGKVIQAVNFYTTGWETYISTREKGILVYRNGKYLRRFIPLLHQKQLNFYKFCIHQQRIYANTQAGLIIFDLHGNLIQKIDRSTGLATNKIVDFAIHGNELWVAHAKGVQTFDLKTVLATISPPLLMLSSVFVNGKQHSYSSNDKFESSDKKFQFVFKVPTLKYRDNIIYHYKLEGLSNEWSTQTYDNHEVTYNSLAPGKYRFILKAESNGHFGEPIIYAFSISAPFYQQWWFILSVALVVLLIITLIYKRQLAIQARKAKHINELNASRLTAIQSQMNPHFIFNSLNSIQDLILRGDIDNSYGFITKFSHLVRRTLSYSDKDFIEFEQEIKLIELYLSLEKLRFKEDLSYVIDTGDIDGILIPPMLIQPFIENALVHGLLHKKGGKKLSIRFYLDTSLHCEIIDNGIGRERAREIKNRQRAPHESFSVNAIKQRFEILEAHFKSELGFTYSDLQENGESVGTKVVLTLPTKYRF